MNDQEIIVEIAKLDGWEMKPDEGLFSTWHNGQYLGTSPEAIFIARLPDYLTSRDAIVPVIEKQDDNTIATICMHIIAESAHRKGFKLLLATPRQLCEALLRATGKWKE